MVSEYGAVNSLTSLFWLSHKNESRRNLALRATIRNTEQFYDTSIHCGSNEGSKGMW